MALIYYVSYKRDPKIILQTNRDVKKILPSFYNSIDVPLPFCMHDNIWCRWWLFLALRILIRLLLLVERLLSSKEEDGKYHSKWTGRVWSGNTALVCHYCCPKSWLFHLCFPTEVDSSPYLGSYLGSFSIFNQFILIVSKLVFSFFFLNSVKFDLVMMLITTAQTI